MFPNILYGGVWHTTSLPRFKEILRTGYILPEPNICDSERWGTALGAESYPYVRSIGGVSVFDFKNFDAEKYGIKYPISNWSAFVPCHYNWDSSVWIKINETKIGREFIGGVELLKQWDAQKEYRRKIMPIIEAAYIGEIPISFFERVLDLCCTNSDYFHNSVTCHDDDLYPSEIKAIS